MFMYAGLYVNSFPSRLQFRATLAYYIISNCIPKSLHATGKECITVKTIRCMTYTICLVVIPVTDIRVTAMDIVLRANILLRYSHYQFYIV